MLLFIEVMHGPKAGTNVTYPSCQTEILSMIDPATTKEHPVTRGVDNCENQSNMLGSLQYLPEDLGRFLSLLLDL